MENNENQQPQYIMFVISEENLSEYIQAGLIARGFVPSQEECDVLGEIFFDYLLDAGIVEEVEEDE